jgi:transposase
MSLKRRRFTREFKLEVLQEVALGKPLAQASREYEVHASTIIGWRRQVEASGPKAFPGNGRSIAEETKISELERKVGQLTMENDLLKKALTRFGTASGRTVCGGSQ